MLDTHEEMLEMLPIGDPLVHQIGGVPAIAKDLLSNPNLHCTPGYSPTISDQKRM